MKPTAKEQFLREIQKSLENNTFQKITFSKYQGEEKDLRNLYVRQVMIKNERMISFLYRYKTKDITKNYSFSEAVSLLEQIMGNSFLSAHFFSTQESFQVEFSSDKTPIVRRLKLSQKTKTTADHNKQKNYMIDSAIEFLREIGVTNQNGQVTAGMYDKFRQINKFIEIVDVVFNSSLLKDKETITIVDYGSGKSYLTFAAYYYFSVLQKRKVIVIGVETREDMVIKSNLAAEKVGYKQLSFVRNTIKNHQLKDIDIVIALHACDTATDDAIIKGIHAKAHIMFLAPCCHKYLRKQMVSPSILKDVLKHGILEQRESEIITDGLRAMTLESYGYKTNVLEFISAEYTSKNLMITAVKNSSLNRTKREQINAIKTLYGIDNYYLDTELNM